MRRDGLGLAVAAALAISGLARAEGSPRDTLARQLTEQAAVAERAIAAVTDKLATAQLARDRRLRAAYRLIHAPVGRGEVMAAARARAAARLLIERDRHERDALAGELAQLSAARQRIAGDAAQLSSIALPVAIALPADGTIARRFGTLAHERSRTTLARRGIDIEVDERSPVTAPAAGTVRYAGPIRGLDHGVILDHGAYVTVVAKLRDVAVATGASIATGDRVGRAARHRVYLEVRVKLGPGGLPIDPEPLLGKPRPELAPGRDSL